MQVINNTQLMPLPEPEQNITQQDNTQPEEFDIPHTPTSLVSQTGRTINEQLTETGDILKKMEFYLRGIKKTRNLETGEVQWEHGKKILPDSMVDELMMHLYTRYNPQTTYGIFRSKTINDVAQEFGLLITDWLCNSYYELKWSGSKTQLDKKSLKLIISDIHYMFYDLLSRAVEGRTQSQIMNMNKVYGEAHGGMDGDAAMAEQSRATAPRGKLNWWLNKIAGGGGI